MCITASHNPISVRLVKPNHSLGCIAVPVNYLHRCTMSRIDKFNMTGDWNTKDIVLYEPRDGPRLFNCSQTSLGHRLCYVSWLLRGCAWLSRSIRAAAAERHSGRVRPRGEEEARKGWDVSTDRSISTSAQRHNRCPQIQIHPSSFTVSHLLLPAPPHYVCLITQIRSHITIRHLYNRGHPPFRLHPVSTTVESI